MTIIHHQGGEGFRRGAAPSAAAAAARQYTQFSVGRPRDDRFSRRSFGVTAVISGRGFQLVIIFRWREGAADHLGGTTLKGSQFAISDFAL